MEVMTEPTRDELLVCLIEECGEVIQAATKCLRFGYDREWPAYGRNDHVLASEIGDVLGVIEALPLCEEAVEAARRIKLAKIIHVKNMLARA
jgi:MazG nucleotide pyrophosphohydrolase domain